VRFLIDTHALLWALGKPDSMALEARDAVADPANLLFVSMASLWECAIKASIGKLDLPEGFFDSIPEAGYDVIPIQTSHLKLYLSLPMHHRDPFDRMLVAQAKVQSLTLITRDPEIQKYDVEFMSC